MKKEPFYFNQQERYIGSLQKDNQFCDFYELIIDGKISYVYVPADAKQSRNEG